MNYQRLKVFAPFFFFLTALIFVFGLLTNDYIYKKTLGKIADNYSRVNDNVVLEQAPYVRFSDDKMLHWDAAIFNRIRKDFYDEHKAGGDWISASFPLFPVIWKISGLSATGIALLNYFLFSISIILLAYTLSPREGVYKNILISLSFPVLLPFLIPYSESAFMFFFSLAIVGLYKKKYWLYFTGIFLASAARSSIVILFLSFLAAEILLLIQNRNIGFFAKELLLKILPAITGTLFAALFQNLTGGNSFFGFIEAQKYWGASFAIPHNITDWSGEGFGVNIAVLFLVVAPAFAYIFLRFLQNFCNKSGTSHSVFSGKTEVIKDFLFHFSIIYFIGIFFFILFFRNGCMYGTYRYIASTPLFFVFLILLSGKTPYISFTNKIFFSGTLLFLSVFFLGLVPYSTNWTFSDLGYFIFIAASFLPIFIKEIPEKNFYLLAVPIILINILWHTYLFNMFLVKAWISA